MASPAHPTAAMVAPVDSAARRPRSPLGKMDRTAPRDSTEPRERAVTLLEASPPSASTSGRMVLPERAANTAAVAAVVAGEARSIPLAAATAALVGGLAGAAAAAAGAAAAPGPTAGWAAGRRPRASPRD